MNDSKPSGDQDKKLTDTPEKKKRDPKAVKQRGKTFANRGVEKRG